MSVCADTVVCVSGDGHSFREQGADVDGIDDEDYSRAYCDGCGPSVRARMVAALPSGGVLAYCFHHGNKHRQALEAQGALIVELTPA